MVSGICSQHGHFLSQFFEFVKLGAISDVVAGTAKHYNYGDKLNRMQRRALRFTWHRLQTRNGGKRVENVFEEVFDRLVRALPSVRDMFATRMFLCAMSRNDTASLRDHAKVTVKMFDVALKNMDAERNKRTDTGSKLDPRIIGSQHGLLRPYGLTGQYWEKLGETIIDVVLGQEAVRDLPGAGQAWVIFTACLVDQVSLLPRYLFLSFGLENTH
ncbi:unnamed protein product [Nippostrongylus brasiliensis]|uniref:GLOBIN domain-containing protein n=1 Tax=Nippostrongylus brasiliensis TaxID=27835 RepID=A0A158R3B7_NIPBR|nr:unnamed protein product [Nippostrongylus brasiliensis]